PRGPPPSHDVAQHADSVAVDAHARTASVAIGANDLAFCDLIEHLIPRTPSVHKRADIQPLVPKMVEVEHRRIAFAAINARMCLQVCEQPPPTAIETRSFRCRIWLMCHSLRVW